MQEQKIKQNLQQIIDIETKTSLMLQNKDNKDQQELPKNKSDPKPPSCSVCGVELTNPNHTLCFNHWLAKQKEIEEAGQVD